MFVYSYICVPVPRIDEYSFVTVEKAFFRVGCVRATVTVGDALHSFGAVPTLFCSRCSSLFALSLDTDAGRTRTHRQEAGRQATVARPASRPTYILDLLT